MSADETPSPSPETIPTEEEGLLARVRTHLAERAASAGRDRGEIDAELISLRDQIAEARLEDVPALIAQMERLQAIAGRRAEANGALVDAKSPYFGHLRLRETTDGSTFAERDVLIGRGTYVDSRKGVRIVDWRHAPVSQLYYRYAEGSPYEERFGDREVEGEVMVRRTVTIDRGELLRISSPQGVFVRRKDGWTHLDPRHAELAGGQGTATRPAGARGTLGVGPDGEQRLDRHLPEIAALIDPRQFELMTAPDSGLVVIQGGAGSGKTTIGLHRIAYLAYAQPKRFAPDRMLVVTYGEGLAAYMSQVLPSLGLEGVDVTTFQRWIEKQRRRAVPWLLSRTADDTPSVVTRLKKHPALMHELERRCAALAADPRARKDSRAVVALWADLLTDLEALTRTVAGDAADPMHPAEIKRAWQWCSERCPALLERDREPSATDADAGEETERSYDDEDVRGEYGVDGLRTEDERATLDPEDEALLVRAAQLVRGPIRSIKKGRELLSHLFVDEAQDLSPVELACLLGQTSAEKSVTLAGDTAQKIFLDNGFLDWKGTLGHLGLEHVTIEPLRIAYRSTREVLEVARYALGPLADPEPPVANRSGAPVEAHRFPDQGAAVAFLADALRPLFAREPRATVAILARWPEQADAYYDGLARAEVPNLRRVRVQDFAFKPGVEVTDVRQVKGLEYDYVILVDVNANVFPADDEARHLFHIAATRAAHQLWLVVTGAPSPLVPPQIIEL
jgi:DNA helicase-2/ATP-dependent DNA helicase PcrA